MAARRYYDADMAGFSIPAAEHSTITSWGIENEALAYQNMLDKFAGKDQLVAVVSDSYDLFHAIDHIWGEQLADKVRNNGGTIVIRPDSGDPITIVTTTIEKLMDKFGYHTNSKGYKVLPDFVRVIQGDGISRHTIELILKAMKFRQLSADNIAFGMGAELLQKINRDSLKFAMKASAIEISGNWQDIYKKPATDTSKASKKGRLAVICDDQSHLTTIKLSELNGRNNLLQKVFSNGKLLINQNFEQIRQRANG